MNTLSAKSIFILVIPAALLAATFWLLPRAAALPAGEQQLLPSLPYAAMALGMILSIHFHRGRAFFALLLLAGAYWTFRNHLPTLPAGITATVLFQALCILVPFNFALLALMRERGIITVAGRLRLVFLVLQALAVGWLSEPGHVAAQQFLGQRFFAGGLPGTLHLPQTALPVLGIAALVIASCACRRQSPIDSSLLGALLAFAVAANHLDIAHVTPVFMTAAAVILSFGILKDSYNMAFRDDLTGLPSRRALNEQLTWLGRHYAVAMVDVDNFKKFNDTYGHDVGDQVLRMVAGKLRSVGGSGRAFRYGGEEFTILFPRRTKDEVVAYLEELRCTIADYEMRLRGDDRPNSRREGMKRRTATLRSRGAVSVTVSIGVAESGGPLRRPADVVKAADQALYRAKNRGRNLVST
ncbi:GGDEF domain-containing protein [Geotalea uraniireducens]|uniref:diguanylate cyclase n=1 Tax=Geotalea uraniireducens TaxID=351604 RepID=A0ABM8ENG9_9BACT|nr:GGDEF domain-containing protein [Geotalea uraniireducens]BDV44144.1 GGDEF domain-containing protein [Geotalea uraniireducens]